MSKKYKHFMKGSEKVGHGLNYFRARCNVSVMTISIYTVKLTRVAQNICPLVDDWT